MRLLDLFCGVGGASAGYAHAGFRVTGVDIAPQPEYGGHEFYQGDVLAVLNRDNWSYLRANFAAIHASPPCQGYMSLGKQWMARDGRTYPLLYEPVRDALEQIGLPYVIENPAARADVVLCGEMFGLGVLRHRKFELGGWTMPQPEHVKHRGRVRGWRHGQFLDGPYVAAYGNGGGKATVDEMREGMGIHWTKNRHSLTEAIPPAYTACIGYHLIRSLA